MKEPFQLDDMTVTRIVFFAALLGLAGYLYINPWLVTWAEENPWLAAPPVIGILAIAGWLFPGLGDDQDGIDIFSDD